MKKDTTNDMTVGSPVSLIIKFMIPMCLGNLFQQFYNIADSIVAGKFIGVNALAAIGSTGSLMFFVTGWLNGLSSGFAILVSQWFGAKQYDKMRHYVAMSIYLAAAFAIVMTIGFEALNEPILRLMNSPEDLMGSVKGYMGIIYAGLIVTAAYNSLAAFLRALGDSKSPLYFLIISAVINVFLDILFIVKIGMGVEGCAYATVIAQAISAVCCLIYIIKKFPILHLKKENFEVSFTSFRYLLAFGIPMGLQFSITAIGSMVMQSANNGLGGDYVSGFTAGVKLKQFTLCPFDAIGTAVSVFCSQNLGAGQSARIIALGIGYGVFAGLILIFFGRPLSMIFVSKDAAGVLDASAQYLRCMGFFYWTLGILNITRMVTQGLGYSGRAFFSGVTEMFARTIVSLCFVGQFGYNAICFADQTAWVAACCYIAPTCFYCVKKVTRMLQGTPAEA